MNDQTGGQRGCVQNQPGEVLRPGAIRSANGEMEWNLWAPRAEHVELLLQPGGETSAEKMTRRGEWFHFRKAGVNDGTRYLFRLPDGDFPDPATRWQPDGVHAASAVFTPEAYQWKKTDWAGIPRHDLVIYELHVGTFTRKGTFAAIIDRFDDLRSLGVTALEIMPVAQFPGERNWGYDGVQLYAAQNSYGGPRELQHLVDCAHQAGLAVILDVVYNHVGPEGNSLGQYGPYFTSAYHTPWGDAINYDGPDSEPVRQFVIENAKMWIRDFRFDGLRLDAVHAIYDLGAVHLLQEIQQAVHQIGEEQQRTVHVIAESDQNNPRLIDTVEQHGLGIDAVWADELHHCIRSIVAGDHQGYFADFGTLEQLAKAYESVFVYDGCYSQQRRRRHGAPVENRDRSQFVVCIHNHDQVGNRALGDRSPTYLSESAQRLSCGLLLISPCIPMLFMGEEYAERHPFPFFCSFGDPGLIKAVNEGRRAEFTGLGFEWENIPEPQAEATFQSAKLTWSWPEGTFSAHLRQLYQDLLQARREWPALRNRERTKAYIPGSAQGPSSTSPLMVIERGSNLIAIANISSELQALPAVDLKNARLRLSTEQTKYGGQRNLQEAVVQLLPDELLIYELAHG